MDKKKPTENSSSKWSDGKNVSGSVPTVPSFTQTTGTTWDYKSEVKRSAKIYFLLFTEFRDAIMYTILGICFLAAFLCIAKQHLVECAGHCKKVEVRNAKIRDEAQLNISV